MHWQAMLMLFVSALAALEIFYALRTGEVAGPLFGARTERERRPTYYWALVGYWGLLLCGLCYGAFTL